ncbi:MAG: HAD family hydrolase [Firmicutes bacterium]|nr:HAD family hydrolase [Bacillota bacterium]
MEIGRKLMVFDFDGTLYRGDEPYRFYAQTIAQSMTTSDREQYLAEVAAHLASQTTIASGDNWEAVVQLARPFLDDPDLWQQAFLKTREYMLGPLCRMEVPKAVREFLQEMHGRVTLAVASNSPAAAADPLLDKLQLTGYFDVIRSDAHKPEGLVPFVQEILGRPCGDADRIASIGDNYRNDIIPGQEHGWMTAHISPHGYFPGPSSVQGRTIEEVLPAVKAWMFSQENAK